MTKTRFAVGLVLLSLIATPASWAQTELKDIKETRPGIGVDAKGNSAFDPSRNVLDLVLAAVKRLDDIMDLAFKRQDDLRSGQAALEELRYASIKENSSLRAEYEDKLRKAEAGRLDANRVVDTNSVTVANERATATASALAKKGDDAASVLSAQLTKSADDVRSIVKTTADEQARNSQQQLAAIQAQFTGFGTRITALEQAGAEGLGKQKFQDPAIADLLREVKRQGDTLTAGAGKSEGISATVAIFMSAAGILILLLSVGIPLILRGRSSNNFRRR